MAEYYPGTKGDDDDDDGDDDDNRWTKILN